MDKQQSPTDPIRRINVPPKSPMQAAHRELKKLERMMAQTSPLTIQPANTSPRLLVEFPCILDRDDRGEIILGVTAIDLGQIESVTEQAHTVSVWEKDACKPEDKSWLVVVTKTGFVHELLIDMNGFRRVYNTVQEGGKVKLIDKP